MSSVKRKRVEVSVKIKKDICLYKEQNSSLNLSQVRDYVLKEHSLDLGKSTVGDILKRKDKWLSIPSGSLEEQLTRESHPHHDDLEKALYMWVLNAASGTTAINDEMLVSKAKVFGELLHVNNFNYSRGWLHRFKHRYGIISLKKKQKQRLEREAGSPDMTNVSTEKETLTSILAEYEYDNIFNLDETGLFYRLEPNYTQATSLVDGTKRFKDHITVALACNASAWNY